MRRGLATVALLAAAATPAPALAQLFSPGKLSEPHAHLEGLSNCTKCHEAGKKLSNDLCLACHEEIDARLEKRAGYHGRLPAEKRACDRCHREHQGRDFPLIDWTPRRFDHRETGWVLRGAHARADCADCHDPRLVADPAVTKLLAKPSKETTYLGLPVRCASCHFDEHRGQVGDDCAKCHGEEKWKPVRAFDHDDTDFALVGRHRDVDCEKCHPSETDAKSSAGTFPAPRSSTFMRFAPLAHDRCTSCHEDPHAGRFGDRCEQCHDERSWKQISTRLEKERRFHEQTRYPLRGAHVTVDCRACHLPLGKKTPIYRGLPFGACTDCHLDAHASQIAGDCSTCHSVESFAPPSYGIEAHERTAYPLEGAHRAVACRRCHELGTSESPPDGVVRALRARGRRPLVSRARFDVGAPEGCATCHDDPHRGQLVRPCADCHRTTAFEDVRFDHDADSRFPLTGAHTSVACDACHSPDAEGVVRYRPLPSTCASCHPDPHAAQFAAAGTASTDCERCHYTESFAKSTFDHDTSRFPLAGKHRDVDCGRCHTMVTVDTGLEVRRYRPLPITCDGCHADFHDGAFDEIPTATTTVALLHAEKDADCSRCHTPGGWLPATFDHAATGFVLAGAHASQRCAACHLDDLAAAIPRACLGCHPDPHRGELGQRCEGCHDERSWRSRFDALAHRRSGFPLSGAHATIPCTECHEDRFSRGFVRAPAACVRCHEDDYRQAALLSIDHERAGFDTSCQRCHTPFSFSRGRFPEHDRCFSISGGPHYGIECRDCHTTGFADARPDGSCDTDTAACTSCHEHTCDRTDGEHDDVPGYQCKDRKCYECHRFAD